MKTDFQKNLGKINIVPQDLGRVLLNIYNNAFYSVSEKNKLHKDGYEPLVSVSTRKNGQFVEILVTDNGQGIPSKNLDKIFQPFFTARPPGEGTGLGLSISYDIIKAHGGEISVKSEEGEGAQFVISLPG
jgi:signal transduction histidine kinase